MIIVVLWCRTVKLYEKARFVLYSMEIQCTSLRYSNNYSCLLNDLASAHCLMISSASEVQHLSVSRCLFLAAPIILPTYLITFSSGTAATSSSTYHTRFNSSPVSRRLFLTILPPRPITFSSGTAATSSSKYLSRTLLHPTKHNCLRCGKREGSSAKYPSPTNTTQDKCKHSTILLHHNHIRFYLT